MLANARSQPSPEAPADRARDLLAGAGLSEVVTWGFVPRALRWRRGRRRRWPTGSTVKNPISADYEVMRTSLLPGLADAARPQPSARAWPTSRLFEVGPVVRKRRRAPSPTQREQVGAAAGRPGAPAG